MKGCRFSRLNPGGSTDVQQVKNGTKRTLNALFNKNWSDRKINDSIGIHRVTISRYRKEWHKLQKAKETTKLTASTLSSEGNLPSDMAQNVPPGQNEVPTEGVVHFQVPTDPQPTCNGVTSKSKVIQYYNEINLKLQNGQHARSIYQDLVSEHQYAGSYDSVKRYVRKLRKLTPDVYARIETPPGEESQVDFGQGAPTLFNGKYRIPWLFVMTLANSRKSYEECVWKQGVETFINCHQNSFAFFGGVTRLVRSTWR